MPAKQEKSSLSLAIRGGLQQAGLFIAKLAGYEAAIPSRSTNQAQRWNTNPNSSGAQWQRVQLMWDGQHMVKNSDFGANYVRKRAQYCTNGMSYAPDTGDTVLDEDLRAYLDDVWSRMGINCSMHDAFSRTADTELPMMGDSGLIWYRDEVQLRLLEVQADRIGEVYYFNGPQERLNGMEYFSGIYCFGRGSATPGQHAAFKIYERADQSYLNPSIYPASDVIYFSDNLMAGYRGVTIFTAALEKVMNREGILYSTMQTMAQQSKIAAIASNNAGEPDNLSYDTVNNTNGTVSYVERMGDDGAVVRYQYNGDSYQVLKGEHPTESFQLAMDKLDEKGCLAVGLPYEFLFTPAKSGGAPSRLSLEFAGREITRLRNHVYRPRLNVISYVTIMDAIERGAFKPVMARNASGVWQNRLLRGAWNFGTLPSADSYRDDKSDVAAIRAGITTRNAVTTKNDGKPFSTVLRENQQEAVAIAKAVQDANKALVGEGYEPTVTLMDIAQSSDNPTPTGQSGDGSKASQQAEESAKAANEAKTQPPVKAALSAYMGDMTVSDLPDSTQSDIARILGTNGSTGSLKVVKYGMVAPELERMADPHNLETAMHNIRNLPNYAAAEEVHGAEDKHILVMNSKVVDGHHFIAKALRGKVTKSLPVLDLTPARFQSVNHD